MDVFDRILRDMKNPYFLDMEEEEDYDLPAIERVIFQGTHTVVIWDDGEKTIVNCFDEAFDQEKGLAMAILKRFISRADFNRILESATVKE